MSTETHRDLTTAIRLAANLQALLLAHGERNWVRGIKEVGAFLEAGDTARAASTYKSMLAGNGSFSDYYIHAEGLDERRRLNGSLDQLRDQLWVSLGL
jgi:hypothetical protein